MSERTVILKDEAGQKDFPIEPGVHTIIFDQTHLRQKAIGDFLSLYIKKQHATKPASYWASNKEGAELIGIAIGYFKVPLDTFYPEVSDIYALDDATLASIIRWSAKFDDDMKKQTFGNKEKTDDEP